MGQSIHPLEVRGSMCQLAVNRAGVRSEVALREFRQEKAFSWAWARNGKLSTRKLTEHTRDEL